ncbi:hypothetical protein HK101_008182 [Irineochytrium annulatum]|nr:hypothetical protein HK101_008182 [Irineochytrium annulatum]
MLLSSTLTALVALACPALAHDASEKHSSAPATVCFPDGATLNSTNPDLCVSGAGDGVGDLTLTVHSSWPGWVGVGIGSSMDGADVLLGWRDAKGTLMARAVTTYHYGINSNADGSTAWKWVTFNGTAPSWAKISFVATHPTTVDGKTKGALDVSGDYIVAFSDVPPGSRNSIADATFMKHVGMQSFTAPAFNGDDDADVNVHRGLLPLGPLGSADNAARIHGVLMFIAWGVAPYIGIFIARYTKDMLGVWWYRLHMGIMLGVCGGFTLSAFLILFLTMPAPHFNDWHQAIGLVVILTLVCQIGLGFYSDAKWTPDRTSIPWWDKAHWWVGRSLALLGTFNLFAGIKHYNEISSSGGVPGIYVWLLIAWLVVVVGAFVFGEMRIGVVHHLGGKAGGVKKSDQIGLVGYTGYERLEE